MTFLLDGFQVVERGGIRLSAGFTAPVDAELPVGELTERVTVTTESPVVDVRGVNQQRSLDRQVIDTIPSGKSYQQLGELIPGMAVVGPGGIQQFDVGGTAVLSSIARLVIHGGSRVEHQLQVDGLPVAQPGIHLGATGVHAESSYGEYAFNHAANPAEIETGGVRINLIPKEGGNTFSGRFFANGTGQDLQARNIDDDLVARGLPPESENRLSEFWSFEASVGGPVVRDRLWFHLGHTTSVRDTFVGGLFPDTEANDLNYTPDVTDPSRQTIAAGRSAASSLRLTWQATSRNKIAAYWAREDLQGRNGAAATSFFVDESAIDGRNGPLEMLQVTWTNPVTNRLLLEAGFSHRPAENVRESDPRIDRTLPGAYLFDRGFYVRGIGALNGLELGRPGHVDRTGGFINGYRASLSYVTGSHAFKAGVMAEHLRQTRGTFDDPSQALFTYQDALRPFIPGFAGFGASNVTLVDEVAPNLGLYVQDQWTRDRMTISGGLRFDYLRAGYPNQTIEPSLYRTEPFLIEGDTPIRFSDLQPRLGVAYDLFGDGRTAIKASANRYVGRLSTGVLDGINPASSPGLSRLWWDFNGDGVVQGDPVAVEANGELVLNDGDPNFGQPVQTTFVDPDWAVGWGNRFANWEYSASVQHELRPNVSVDVGYFYRTYVNFSVEDDRNLGPEDFTSYTLFVPEGPEFPNGGGYSVTGFVDQTLESLATPQDIVTTSANPFGGESQTWKGVDVTLDARLRNLMLRGGVSTGSTSQDRCALWAAVPESSRFGFGELQFCKTSSKWLTQVKLLAAYTLPYDIQLAGTYRGYPGPERQARWFHGPSATDLGRPFSTGSKRSNILEPGTAYLDRVNLFDLRFTKLFDINGRSTVRAMVDVYNVLNSNTVVSEDSNVENNRAPQQILQARFLKFGFRFEF